MGVVPGTHMILNEVFKTTSTTRALEVQRLSLFINEIGELGHDLDAKTRLQESSVSGNVRKIL